MLGGHSSDSACLQHWRFDDVRACFPEKLIIRRRESTATYSAILGPPRKQI